MAYINFDRLSILVDFFRLSIFVDCRFLSIIDFFSEKQGNIFFRLNFPSHFLGIIVEVSLHKQLRQANKKNLNRKID
jgi:hypothetical protein